ncbi:hypothetical protein B0A55_11756, partial [Friedmanniomyces simplex]
MSGISGAISKADVDADTNTDLDTLNSDSTHYTTRPHRYGQLRKKKVTEAFLRKLHKQPTAAEKHRGISTERIKDFWRCKLADSLPRELKPRLRAANGKRVGAQQQDQRRLPAG